MQIVGRVPSSGHLFCDGVSLISLSTREEGRDLSDLHRPSLGGGTHPCVTAKILPSLAMRRREGLEPTAGNVRQGSGLDRFSFGHTRSSKGGCRMLHIACRNICLEVKFRKELKSGPVGSLHCSHGVLSFGQT